MTCEYQGEIADLICASLSAGLTVKAACEKVGMLPYEYYQWRRTHEEFRQAVEAAKNDMSHAVADSCLEIADEATPEDVRVAELRVKSRQWYASVLNPARYGSKVMHGGDPAAPIALKLEGSDVKG